MSDKPISFHDFQWACGHTGPAYCSTCHASRIAELEAENERQRTALQDIVNERCYEPRDEWERGYLAAKRHFQSIAAKGLAAAQENDDEGKN